MYEVKPIPAKDTYDFLLCIHYAHRIPSITWAFGLFEDGALVGACTFGTPPSHTLLSGVAGAEYKTIVKELNRLVLVNNKPNEASFLVSQAFRLLPKPMIVVSYADASVGHIGVVYQALGFLYTGLSAKRTDAKIKGQEHLHNASVTDKFRGKPGSRVALLKEAFGDDYYLKARPRKHRYIKFLGSRKQTKQMRADLRYKVVSYPKSGTSIALH